jgi:hypothetical protein
MHSSADGQSDIGGMGNYLATVNMVSALTSEQERPMYLGFVGLNWAVGIMYVSLACLLFEFEYGPTL